MLVPLSRTHSCAYTHVVRGRLWAVELQREEVRNHLPDPGPVLSASSMPWESPLHRPSGLFVYV